MNEVEFAEWLSARLDEPEMSKAEFAEWLEEQIRERAWKPADLAYAGRINPGTLSNILTGMRGAGPDVCLAIAKGLNLPPETVFRKAGLLPPKKPMDELREEILHYYDRMPDDVQAHFRTLARALAESTGGYEVEEEEEEEDTDFNGAVATA